MRQKFLAIGDDSWIEDEAGERVFRVDGKALPQAQDPEARGPRWKRGLQDPGAQTAHQGHDGDRGPDGQRLGLIQKAMITPLRERFDVEVPEADDLKVRGKILDHEYRIEQGDEQVAEVSKRWLRMRDTYGIEIEPGQDDVLILAIAVALDAMEHDEPG